MFKKELRQLYKNRRQQLSGHQKADLDQKMTHYLKEMDWSAARYIHVFLSIDSMKEPNTQFFINWIWEKYPATHIVVPKVTGESEITSYRYERHSLLGLSDWGIPEITVEEDIIAEELIDVVIIPLLVCDKEGNRVGYGKGFYDRFLKKCKADVYKVGLSYFEPVEKIRDVNLFDIPLDICITPERIIKF